MSPTVLREKGYRVMIFTDDHTPAHVHVFSAGKEAKIALDPILVIDNGGFGRREINDILALIEEHQNFLLVKWDMYHPKRS